MSKTISEIVPKEAVYQHLDLEKNTKGLLEEFDEKLNACLVKIRKSGTADQKECIKFFQEQANQLRAVLTEPQASKFTRVINKAGASREIRIEDQMLGRAIKSFDALLEGRADEKNNEQLLILARDLSEQADAEKLEAELCRFLGAALLVFACVFAVPTCGISLLFLINVVHGGVGAVVQAKSSLVTSSKQEKLSSFSEAGQGFFPSESGGADGERVEKPEHGPTQG